MKTMNTMFRVLRSLPAGELRTADQLSQELGITRQDVTQTVDEAREYGVDIQARQGGGYVISGGIDWLGVRETQQAMGDCAARYQIRILDAAISTNDEVLAEAVNPPGRLVVAAELQCGGRGRLGRRWNSGLGNSLTFSILYRFSKRGAALSASSLVVGVALMRALNELGVRGALLKWPNDLITPAGKLGGVLIETHGGGVSALPAIVIGIGLNARLPDKFESAIGQPVVDLYRLGVRAPRSTILGVCLRHVEETMARFEAQGFENLRKEWTAHAAYIGQPVVLAHAHGETQAGVMAGISEDGALVLAAENGHRKIYSGDMSMRPAQSPHSGSAPS
ncbi:MAG: biotin--[acetyl-CoA-carboxylase] ligase [Betaproteobacteria bacterium]|nr:biotin--[acetyl-CoA-carboxylase] ligase [Betaproteobacteria bacterium]